MDDVLVEQLGVYLRCLEAGMAEGALQSLHSDTSGERQTGVGVSRDVGGDGLVDAGDGLDLVEIGVVFLIGNLAGDGEVLNEIEGEGKDDDEIGAAGFVASACEVCNPFLILDGREIGVHEVGIGEAGGRLDDKEVAHGREVWRGHGRGDECVNLGGGEKLAGLGLPSGKGQAGEHFGRQQVARLGDADVLAKNGEMLIH